MSSKKIAIGVFAAVIVIIGIILCVVLSTDKDNDDNLKNNNRVSDTMDDAKTIETLIKCSTQDGIKITENYAPKGTVSYDSDSKIVELPDIDSSYPLVVDASGKQVVAEIFSSPEKAGKKTDGWLRELAEEYNNSNQTINGKSAGISLRSVSSGTQIDYISSGIYTPDAITPSASMWADMLIFNGVKLVEISDRMVGNVAGIVIENSKYSQLEQELGTVDIQSIITATENGTLTAGYTNPFSSTSGLNFLASTLYSYDNNSPLSADAISGFNKFQNNVPFVAYNTLQMREAAANSTFTTFINEYQGYVNDVDMKSGYKFIPYGIRHDNPLYAIDGISNDKLELIKAFNEYCKTPEAKKKADNYGFNKMDDYKDSIPKTDGNTWLQMQKIWKKNKNATKPIAAVFVIDTSGSMSGTPLAALKESMTNSMKYINSNNYIGIVSYSSDINVDLPIKAFDINQQAYFQGAIDQLSASGTTSTFSAIAKATLMLDDFKTANPDINVQPTIFLLSDGEQNTGADYKDIEKAIRHTGVPIYTIAYNDTNLDELKKISSINEAASINAGTDDVVYQLKNLFNANL